jgi:hypothetical protein
VRLIDVSMPECQIGSMQNSIDTLDFVQLSVTFKRKLVRTVSCKAANSGRCGPFSRRLSPLFHTVALCGYAPTTPRAPLSSPSPPAGDRRRNNCSSGFTARRRKISGRGAGSTSSKQQLVLRTGRRQQSQQQLPQQSPSRKA